MVLSKSETGKNQRFHKRNLNGVVILVEGEAERTERTIGTV